jgi:radical SAM superfamily enzyme YgiQ (UPF0313 family)
MNILIVAPRYDNTLKKDFTYSFPLGLAYVSSTLKSKDYNVDCLNLNHYYGTISNLIANKLNSKRYDIICTGGNALIYNCLDLIIKEIRKHKSSPKIILGGPIITSEPELILKSLKPDFGVIGEGEITIIELLKNIDNYTNLKNVKGIVFIENNLIKLNPKREPIGNLSAIPFPDLESFGFNEHLNNAVCNNAYYENLFDFPRTYPLLGSRGCPFNCTFCWHSERYRERSIEDIINELEHMITKYKINNILIYDDCFSANKERLYNFCKKIKELSKRVDYEIKWTCQLLVNTVDKEMLQLMKDAGCNSISYGFESFSHEVLKSMRKPITPKQIHKAFNQTLDVGIAVQANFIFGDIAETKLTAQKTINYWKNNCHAQVSLGFIKPYPGSEIYNSCIKNNIIKDKLNFIRYDIPNGILLNMTKNMSDKEFKHLDKTLSRLLRTYGKFVYPKLKKTKKNSIYSIKVRCPFCKGKILYKNCLIRNKLNYNFGLICRECNMRFSVINFSQRFSQKNYYVNKALKLLHKKLRKFGR